MDGTPHLLTDVKFSERRRGYDPEEVDNFLERVSSAVAQLQDKLREATARAEEADGLVAAAQRAQAAAEAELAQTGSDQPLGVSRSQPSADPEADAEQASRILLMAQKTADATIEDANTAAQDTLSEARARAASLVTEAASESEKTRADAKRDAETLVEQRREVIVREVRELEELKNAVRSDIDILSGHLDDQRARIRRGVEALALVLDDPEGLRVDTPPQVHDTSLDEVLAESPTAPTPDADEVGDAEETEERDSPPPLVTDAEGSDNDSNLDKSNDDRSDDAKTGEDKDREGVVVLRDGIDVSGVDLTASPEPARAPGGIFGATSQSAFDAQATDGAPHLAAVPDERPEIDLAEPELFTKPERDEQPGAPTQQFTPFAESDDPLGPPDDEADKAMRAFFEADFETSDPQAQKSRFGFRR